MIKHRRVSLDHERKLLIHMITSTEFLRAIVPVLDVQYLKSNYSRIVATWIIEYYEKIEEAPARAIEDIYLDKKKFIRNEEDLSVIGDFIGSLSEQYEQGSNVTYSINQAIEYLKKRSLEVLAEGINGNVESGRLLEAENLVSTYRQVEQKKVKGIKVLDDIQAIFDAFNFEAEYLFRLPGVLGEAIGPFLRGDFFSFLAFMKKGKSHALSYCEEAALAAGLSVVTFNLEMTDRQVLRRKWMSLTGRPAMAKTIRIPYFAEDEDDPEKWVIKYREEEREGFPRELHSIEALRAEVRSFFRGNDSVLISLPSRSATVEDLEKHLINLEHFECIKPDVVIVDYADYLRSSEKGEFRHKLDEIWSGLRRMALERDECWLTASQSSKAGATADVSEENAAEDVRKLAHVTSMVGINQTKKEKRDQIYRFELLLRREGIGGFSFDQVIALSCLDAGRLIVDSRYVKEVDYEQEDEKERKNGRVYS